MPFVPKHPPKSAKSRGVSHGVSRETRDTVFWPIDAADPVVLPSAKKVRIVKSWVKTAKAKTIHPDALNDSFGT